MLGTVTHIKAKTTIGVNRNPAESSKKLRVAAYCRVSTDSEEQISSYESQVRYYKEKIEERDDWKLVKIFADEAISGTKIDKREEFQRMINSALAGEIDLIMTKSISRFARNTLDTLKYVRLLKEQNVAIYFEEENINTLTMDGELLLTILSSVAQQEVHNTSEHVKKGLKMKMQRGELIGFQGCLGYDYDNKTKTLIVNKEEAETVRYIFKRYLEGAGATVIARELKELGYKTKNGNLEWRSSGILGIIGNEKYMGDILLGKTFTVDPISKRRLANLGESDQFYLENHHEPIVSKEVYNQANEIRKKKACPRRGMNQYNDKTRERITRAYSFSSMLQCGYCGCALTRRVKYNSKSNPQMRIWQCMASTKGGKEKCGHSLAIDEDLLKKAFLESINALIDQDNSKQMKEFLDTIENTILSGSPTKKITDLEARLSKLEKQKDNIVELRVSGIVSKEDCEKKYASITKEIEMAKGELDRYQDRKREQSEVKGKLKDFKETILKHKRIDEFQREILETTVDKIIVGGFDDDGNPDPHRMNFIFKCGVSEKDFIGKYDVRNAIRLTEFECEYPHFVFEKTDGGSKRKRLVKSVHVIVSLNMEGERKDDGIQND